MVKKKRGSHRTVKDSFSRPSSSIEWQSWMAIAAIFLVYVVLRLPGINIPLDRDEGAFGYMGQLIQDGKLPYLDGLDHKPPGAFYINALALYLVPSTEQGIHEFLLIYNLITLVCIFYLGKIYFRSLSAGLWIAFAFAVFSASPAIQGFTASTEMWMLLPIVLSLLLAVPGARKSDYRLLFLSGAAGAAACWIKPTAFTSILFVFLFVPVTVLGRYSDDRSKGLQAALKAPSSWLSGALVLSALPVFYYSYRGILSQFLYWSFQHNAAYAGLVSVNFVLQRLGLRFGEILHGDFLTLGLGLFGTIFLLVKKKPGGYFILSFFLFSLMGTIPGFGYRHYFAQLAPAAAIAGGTGLSALVGFFNSKNKQIAAAMAAAVLMVVAPVGMNRQYYLESDANNISRRYFGANPFPESRALADLIARDTSPRDPVFILGSEPQILFYAKRQSPSPFVMAYPWMASYPRYREFQEQLWHQLQAVPPKYVLDIVNLPDTLLWDGKANLEVIRQIRQWLRREYQISGVMAVTGSQGGWLTSADSPLLRTAPCVYVFRRKG